MISLDRSERERVITPFAQTRVRALTFLANRVTLFLTYQLASQPPRAALDPPWFFLKVLIGIEFKEQKLW